MAPAEALRAVLGVEPGSVAPFGLGNTAPGAVRTVIDVASPRDHEWVYFHPLVSNPTAAIRPADLPRFLDAPGHRRVAPELPDGSG